MKLTEARTLFAQLRKDERRIIVRRHAWADYPERGFTAGEIRQLVMESPATLVLNAGDSPTAGSFHFKPVDEQGRNCKLVVVLEVDPKSGHWIIVISAYREV